MAVLTITKTDGSTDTHSLVSSSFSVGRGIANDLVIENPKTPGICILTADNNICNITFGGDLSLPSEGVMTYTHPTDMLHVHV